VPLLLLLLLLLPAAAGPLEDYRVEAQEQSPAVQAAWQRWQAAQAEIAVARALPEPMLDLGLMLRSGQLRVGLSQAFPWPTGLQAEGQAARAEAMVAQRAFEAQAVEVAAAVERAYWELWELRAAQAVLVEHGAVLAGLSGATRARLEVGQASLADVQQVDLAAARLEDSRLALQARERAAEAELRALLGRRDRESMLTDPQRPPLAQPSDSPEALEAAVLAHPWLGAAEEQVAVAEAMIRRAKARGAPEFNAGVEWTLPAYEGTGDHVVTEPEGLMVGLGVRLTLWQRSYAQGVVAAKAGAEGARAEQRAMGDEALAMLEATRIELADSERRARLIEQTLLPQAQASLDSLLGALSTDRGSLAQVLMAQRELLELRLEADMVRAAHARAWAALEQLSGRPLTRSEGAE